MDAWLGIRMLEKRWKAIPPQTFVSSGTALGQITVSDATLFRVKQQVIISADTIPSRDDLEIKRVIDSTTILIGPKSGNIDSRENMSAYVAGVNPVIYANEQLRSKIPEQEIERLTYEEEPYVARRVIVVDKLGRPIDMGSSGPVPTEWDDVVITRDSSGDPSISRYYLNGNLIRTLAFTYDGNKNIIRVKVV